MKYTFILFILLHFGQANAQKDTALFPFEEWCISINRTALSDDNTEDRAGFGAGVYHLTKSGKIINLKFGLEYNRTSIFKKHVYDGHFSNLTNITFNLNTLSIPILANVSFGKKTKLFIDAGPYIDINTGGRTKGTRTTNSPYQPYSQNSYSQKFGGSIDYGIAFGIGLRQRIAKHEILIKPDFKYSLKYVSRNSDSFYDSYIRNRYIRLVVGFRINGGS